MIEDLKIFLGITDDSKNAFLEIWELEAKEFIKSIIGDFEDTVKSDYFRSKNGKVFIPGINVRITKVEKNKGCIMKPIWEEITDFRFVNGCLNIEFIGEIKVSYSVGYLNIPEDIKMAIKLFVKEKFEFDSGKIKKEVVDGDSIEFNLDNESKNTINSLLNKYKNYDFSA